MGILRDRMIEEMKLRNFSPATQESYVYAVSRLAKYHHKSPDQLSKEDIRAYNQSFSGVDLTTFFTPSPTALAASRVP
jgi:integrase/recombinase XerD